MALKALRDGGGPANEDIRHYMNATAERGRIVIYDTSTTGLGDMDDANSYVKMSTGAEGVPAGVLMNDVVDVDLSRFRLNAHKDEVQKNSKVTLWKRGMVRTNVLKSGDNPAPGAAAYYTTSGQFTTTNTSVQVGRFVSGKDAEGYIDVAVNL